MPAVLIPGLGIPEMVLILAILALLFGARKLPELGRGLGEGIRNFRGSMRDAQTESSAADSSDSAKS